MDEIEERRKRAFLAMDRIDIAIGRTPSCKMLPFDKIVEDMELANRFSVRLDTLELIASKFDELGNDPSKR